MPPFKSIPHAALLVFLVVLSIVWATTMVFAEQMRTNTKTKLRAHPGEAGKVLGTLQPDQHVEVLERQGRWLRVRVGKKIGWITRTTVEPLGSAKPDGSDGDWSKNQDDKKSLNAGAASVDKRHVTAKRSSKARREPKSDATVVFTLTSNDMAVVDGQSDSGEWLLLQNQDGQMGWVRAARLKIIEDPDKFKSTHAGVGDFGAVADTSSRSVRKQRIVAPRVEAGLGYRGFGMEFDSNGGAGLDQYRIEASSALTRVGAWIPLEISGFVLEVGGSYAFSIAKPGIRYQNQGDISFITHDAQASANIGYRFLDDLLTVAATGGFQYSVFRVDDVANIAYLPSERLVGVTAGGFVELAPARGKYTVRSGFRMLLAGDRTQTPGLEDGAQSSANAWWAHLDVDYAVWSALDVAAGYMFERASTIWTGPSARRPGVTAADRQDNNHLLYVGVGRAF